MRTEWIEPQVDGSRMPCYLAIPAEPARAGIIVLQEIFGVNGPMRAVAELCASLGYLAIVPALFHRTDPDFQADYDDAGMAKGVGAASQVTREAAAADIDAAAAALRERLGEHAKVATWGFCFGGSMAFLAATLPGIDASVSFYGTQIAASRGERPALLDLAPSVRAPLLLGFGGEDQSITPAHRDAIRAALDRAAKTYEFYVEEAEGHAFFRNGPDSNDGARDIWPHVRRFLDEELGTTSR